MKTLIKNCRVLQDNRLIKKNIIVDNQKIHKITNKSSKADITINARNNIVLPGLIDSHVHFRDPGLTHKENFLSGSIAAAKGGITTILDMPNTIPPTTTVELLNQKRELAKKSIVNYGFHFGSTVDNINEIKKVKNIASVKVFMDVSTGDMRIDNGDILLNIMKHSRITTVHAEGDNVLKAINLVNKIRNKLYLCHVSTEKELRIMSKNKTDKIYAEATPHHLFLTVNDFKRLGAYAKMKPVLKSKKDQDALWKAVKTGLVDTIATDHAPHTKEEKEDEAPYGVPGVETMLPLLLNAVNNNRLALQEVVSLTSSNPARIFGIRNKGLIKEGYDADLTIIDMNKKEAVKNDKLLTKCAWSPFDNKILKGWPITTIVNGNIVYDNGNIYDNRAGEVEFN